MMNRITRTGLFFIGIIVGQLLTSIFIDLGEQRYSEAIKQCIIEKGPNK